MAKKDEKYSCEALGMIMGDAEEQQTKKETSSSQEYEQMLFVDEKELLQPYNVEEDRTLRQCRRTEAKSRRVQLLLQPSVYEIIKAKAEEEGNSFNDYVHRLLEEEIKRSFKQ